MVWETHSELIILLFAVSAAEEPRVRLDLSSKITLTLKRTLAEVKKLVGGDVESEDEAQAMKRLDETAASTPEVEVGKLGFKLTTREFKVPAVDPKLGDFVDCTFKISNRIQVRI